MSAGFAQMIIMDMTTFNRQHYDFRFVRREFLGDVARLNKNNPRVLDSSDATLRLSGAALGGCRL